MLRILGTSVVVVILGVGLGACASEDPSCEPGEQTFRFCSDDAVWECPVGTPAQIAAKQEREDRCAKESDPVQCLLDSADEVEMVPARLEADCGEAGQVCREELGVGGAVATCKDP